MRRDVLEYDLMAHPEKDSINLLRHDYYQNKLEVTALRKNLENLNKDEKREAIHYIFALESQLTAQESEIRKKIQSHLPTLYQPFFGTKVKISNV